MTLDTDFSTVDYATRNILDVDEIEEMCNDYLHLKIAYEKFKHVYDSVYPRLERKTGGLICLVFLKNRKRVITDRTGIFIL